FRRSRPGLPPKDARDRSCRCGRACSTSCGSVYSAQQFSNGTRWLRELARTRETQEQMAGKSFSCSSGVLLYHSGNSQDGQQRALQTGFTPGRFVPFLQRMRTAPASACADGDGVDSEGERNVGVRGGALEARFVSDIFIGGTKSSQQW